MIFAAVARPRNPPDAARADPGWQRARQAGILRLPPATPFQPVQGDCRCNVVEAHGARIPQIGLGTMTLKGDICVQAVKTALQLGYRHIDTAAFYGNEDENGEGLRQSGVKREEVSHLHQGARDTPAPDEFRKVARPKPRQSEIALCRSAADPLEQQGHPVQDSASARCARPRRTARPSMSASPISPPRCWTRPGP